MEVNYKRIRGISYMILHEDQAPACQHYQKEIFLGNRIPGLVFCKIQRLNGEEYFYYDITGCQSLGNLYDKEKLSRKNMEEILQSWLKAYTALGEYLLDADFLLLNPSYIYRDTQTGSYLFTWFPFQLTEEKKEFQTLAEYFLPKIDHGDKSAVALGYGIYKEAAGGTICPDVVKNFLYEPTPDKQEKPLFPEDEDLFADDDPEEDFNEKEHQKLLDEFFSEKDEDSVSYGLFGGFVGIFLLCGILFLLWHFRLLSLLQLAVLTGFLIILTGSGALLYYFLIQKKKVLPKKDKRPAEKSPLRKNQKPAWEDFSQEEIFSNENLPESLTVLLEEPPHTVPCPCLHGTGKNSGKIFVLDKECTLIGKWKASADICLDIPTVSRIHAKIMKEGAHCYIIDLNSKNGTKVNGIPLNPEEKRLLKENDTISFAKEEFRYTFPVSTGPMPSL